MSHVAVLHYVPSGQKHFRDLTVAASTQGWQLAAECLEEAGRLFQVGLDVPQPTMEERLGFALARVKLAVHKQARYLGGNEARQLTARLSVLFDPEEWEEGEAIPSYRSAATLVRAIMEVGHPVSTLSISRHGNLTAMWRADNMAVSVEGLPDGTIAWAVAVEHEDAIDHVSSDGSSVGDLRAALDQRA